MAESEGEWLPPPAEVILGASEVHVWRASLDTSAKQIQQLARLLAPDERARADRFHFERDRLRFIAGRARLRLILSRYTGIAASHLHFSYSTYGKPSLVAGLADDLCFNVSHAEDVALCAFTRSGAIGVDVERVRTDVDIERLAAQFFSARENDALRRVPDALKPTAFYNCWTRKEAYVKAHGLGLSLPLDQFDVSLVPDEPARLLASRIQSDEVEQWSLIALRPDEGFVAALALAPPAHQVKTWLCPDL